MIVEHHRQPKPALARRLVVALALGTSLLLPACSTLPGWMILQGRSAITDHRHFDNATIAHAPGAAALPRAEAELRWPGGQDRATAEADLAARGTVALLVARRGQVVYERYFDGYGPGSVATSFSMAKSVVSLLLGMAIDEGRVSGVDDPVTRYLPELRDNDPRFERITLRHLLSMRSGIAFDEGYGSPFSEAAAFYLTDDLWRQVRKLRVAREPDQAYAYSSGDTQLLAMAVERAFGQPLARLVEQRLWQPLGMQHDASWSLDSTAHGVARGFCCLNARAVDYLRLGLLALDDGRWNGKTLVSADWLRRSTAAQDGLPGADDAARRNIEAPGSPRAAFYAWQWRRRPALPLDAGRPLRPGTSFYAQGLYGQVMLVDPERQTVVLRLGRHTGDRHWPSWMDQLARLNP